MLRIRTEPGGSVYVEAGCGKLSDLANATLQRASSGRARSGSMQLQQYRSAGRYWTLPLAHINVFWMGGRIGAYWGLLDLECLGASVAQRRPPHVGQAYAPLAAAVREQAAVDRVELRACDNLHHSNSLLLRNNAQEHCSSALVMG